MKFKATVDELMHSHTFKVNKYSIFSPVCFSLSNDNNGMNCGGERCTAGDTGQSTTNAQEEIEAQSIAQWITVVQGFYLSLL